MATCCFLGKREGLHQLDHTVKSNLSKYDFVARSQFSKLGPCFSERNEVPKPVCSSPDISRFIIEAILEPYLDCGSDKMSSTREDINPPAEATLVSSGSNRFGSEEESNSSSDNRDARENSISRRRLSNKRTRMGDTDLRTFDTATNSTHDQNAVKKLFMINPATQSNETLIASGRLNDLVYSREDASWRNSDHSTIVSFSTSTSHKEVNKKIHIHDQRDDDEWNLYKQNPDKFCSYVGNTNSNFVNALTTRKYMSKHDCQFTDSVSPKTQIDKRLMMQSEDLATPRFSSVALTPDSTLSAKDLKGCKEMISESIGREPSGSFDWNLLYRGLENVPGIQNHSGSSIHQQRALLSMQENMKSGFYPGLPGILPFPSQVQYPDNFLQDSQMNKSFESSQVQLERNIPVKVAEPYFLQNTNPESLVRMLNNSQSSTLLLPSASHPVDQYRSRSPFYEYPQSSQRSTLQSSNVLPAGTGPPVFPSHVVGQSLQSSAPILPNFPCHSSMSLPAHSRMHFPSLSLRDPNVVGEQDHGKARDFSEVFESMGLQLQKPYGLDSSPSVMVVMEGRSIGRSLCLHNYDSYESFANALREMFEGDFSSGGLSTISNEACNLESAIPGHIIAYEDAENDLLLAGDLPWRDFLRAAKRIRILPSKACRNKGEN